MTYKAALDTSTAFAALAVTKDDNLCFELNEIPLGRASGGVTTSMTNAFQSAGISLSEVREWTIGLGPGSFSGIRIGAALIKGICAGTGAAYRGVPSSVAMASALSAMDVANVAVLHDGRRGEALTSPYVRNVYGEWEPKAAPYPAVIAELSFSDREAFVVMRTDRCLPELTKAKLPLTILDKFPVISLTTAPGTMPATVEEMERSVQPVYVRPATYAKPTAYVRGRQRSPS